MKKLPRTAVLTLTACAVGVACAHSQSASIPTLADVAAACESSTKTAGFGSVVVDQDLHVRHERVTVAVPCIIYLREGAALSITDSELHSAHLVVTDDAESMPLSDLALAQPSTESAAEEPTLPEAPLEPARARVRIERSTLTGDQTAGFLVRLLHPEGHIAVVDSTLDYPASLRMTTTNTEATGSPGGFEATGSKFRSMGPATEGIWVVASGPGRFIDDQFETTANEGLALLVTQPCDHERVTGATGRCHSP